MIETVTGPVAAADLGQGLAAETLLRTGAPGRGNAGRPASDVAFERVPVTIEVLGRVLLGAPNLDDQTLAPEDAERALRSYAAVARAAAPVPAEAAGPEVGPPRRPLVVALADPAAGAPADSATLARLSRDTGVAIVRGVPGGAPAAGLGPHPGGVVGAIDPSGPAGIEAAARSAAASGRALVLAPPADLAEAGAALERLRASGLRGARVMLTGAAHLIRRRRGAGAGVGVDPARLDALIGLAAATGATVCFDELGRIPTVRTVVSDHDVALAILRCAEAGLGAGITLSVGARAKHRLTAFGGNGLEFVAQQFLPYLAMLGGDPALREAVGGGTLRRLLQRTDSKAV
ncbi:hypothetical protein [Leucobacter luti]|uniref:Phosphotriesterase-related protein n=1 Tax=Leucobacter luti TaxID=340320 RepID=A0A4Q7U6V2_9MICO|nr:hypothetical protein [Leucobacter luti]MBL3701012.1 hypothetical protein [Leucobacter luti]RZT68767.1 phosphotriesterase-related protein [Leucobacter luti]